MSPPPGALAPSQALCLSLKEKTQFSQSQGWGLVGIPIPKPIVSAELGTAGQACRLVLIVPCYEPGWGVGGGVTAVR